MIHSHTPNTKSKSSTDARSALSVAMAATEDAGLSGGIGQAQGV
jgi:hypothetical protein